jgi:group I intron endonuclease
MEGTLYVLKNNVNDKHYVGQTNRPLITRLTEHLSRGYLLTRAIKKYGSGSFTLVLVKYAEDGEALLALEREMIKKYNTLQPDGYNILDGGQVGEAKYWTGKERDESTKQKISATKKANGDSVGEKNAFYGKRHSPEIQAIIKRKAAEWRATPEAQEYMAAANKVAAEKRKGHVVSEETREKIRQANKGRPPSELARQRSRETKLGTKASLETRVKMSAAHLGKKMPSSHGIKSRENNLNRITDEQKAKVYKTREMIADNKPNAEIARTVGFTYEMVRKIRNGSRYGWLK